MRHGLLTQVIPFTSLPIESGSMSMKNMMLVMSSWGMKGRLESLVMER